MKSAGWIAPEGAARGRFNLSCYRILLLDDAVIASGRKSQGLSVAIASRRFRRGFFVFGVFFWFFCGSQVVEFKWQPPVGASGGKLGRRFKGRPSDGHHGPDSIGDRSSAHLSSR